MAEDFGDGDRRNVDYRDGNAGGAAGNHSPGARARKAVTCENSRAIFYSGRTPND